MRVVLLLTTLVLSACASHTAAVSPVSQELGREIATVAVSMHGAPYRYGGSNPKGFDCSGLVLFSHDAVGIPVPRTAAEQHRAASPVSPGRQQSGDLVFFRFGNGSVSHVGVVVESGRFVHAPSSGKHVVISRLDDGYWKSKVAGYGRFYQ